VISKIASHVAKIVAKIWRGGGFPLIGLKVRPVIAWAEGPGTRPGKFPGLSSFRFQHFSFVFALPARDEIAVGVCPNAFELDSRVRFAFLLPEGEG
jgi:hypothetical protein